MTETKTVPGNSQPGAINSAHEAYVDVRWLRLAVENSLSEDIISVLSSDEVERVQRTRMKDTRHAFIQTRVALRVILGIHLNRPPADIKFSYSKLGKPELSSHMHAGQNRIHFNVSHSREYALIAVCENYRVGVDIECRHRKQLQGRKLARRYFSRHENDELDALANEQRTHAFYTCWARKEAYAKAHGLGIQIGLQTFDVSLSPTEPARIINTRPNSDEARRWSLHDLNIDAKYAAALAIEREHCKVHLAVTQFRFS